MFEYSKGKTDDDLCRYKIMSNLSLIRKNLISLGLTQSQADIYILLLQKGNLRISDITKLLNLPRSSVYENLKGLFNVGLAEEIIENSFKLIRSYPIQALKNNIDEQIVKLQKQTLEINKLSKTLDKLQVESNDYDTTVRYYSGRAGARQLFWNTFKAKETIYVYSEWGRGVYLGIKFYQNFVSESYNRDFEEHVLTNSSPRVLNSIKQHIGTSVSRTKKENIRLIQEEEILINGETLIYDNIYAQIYLKGDNISGFEVESQQFVDTQRAIFEKIWDYSKPLTEVM